MITRIFYGLAFLGLFGFFIYIGFLQSIVDFIKEFVASFNSFGIFFNDPQLAVLAGIIGVIIAFAVVMSFKK